MNVNTKVLVLVVLVVASLAGPEVLGAQEGPLRWVIGPHPFDSDQAAEQISAAISEGYRPVGIEVDPGAMIYVLYVYEPEHPVREWNLVALDNMSSVNADISFLIQEGYVPSGISFINGVLYVLSIKQEHAIDGWRLVGSEPGATAFQEVVLGYSLIGFRNYGISYDGNQVWYLMLRDNLPEQATVYAEYQNDGASMGIGLTQSVQAGRRPTGLMIQGDKVIVPYAVSE